MQRLGAVHILVNNTGGPAAGTAIEAKPQDYLAAMSMHRNDIAAEEVAKIAGFAAPADSGELSEGTAILGDVALYQGRYREALRLYRAAEAI